MASSGSRSKPTVRGAKAQVRGGKAKPRRAPVKSSTDIPILAIVVGGVLLAVFIGLLIYGAVNSKTTTGPPAVAATNGSIPCDHGEQIQSHHHAALQIMEQGTVHPLPSGIGIQGGETAAQCFYWLHVHASSPDVIHIESPADRVFTLGDFFKVWDTFSTYNGGPRELLDSTHVSTLTVGANQSIVVYVDLGDGKGAKVWDGDPNKIILKSHEVITIEITPPTTNPPPPFTFKQGL